MKVKTQCRHCGKLYFIASEHLGKVTRCKKCHEYFEMAAYDELSATSQPALNPVAGQPAGESPPQIDAVAPASGNEQLPASPPAAETAPAPQPAPGLFPTQTVTCPQCGYSAPIPRTAGYLKARCPQCGAWFKIKPPSLRRPKTAANRRGRGRPLRLALILFLLLILLAGYFAAPALWPEFSKSLS